VLAVDVGAEHMLLDLRLPPSKTIAARGRRATERALQWLHVKFVIGAELDGSEVSMLVGEPAPNPIELRVSQATIAWKLSPRQADVLPLLVLGAANKEIAQRLGTAENTVEFHVTALLRKAKVPSRAQLAARFWALGD
jgi:DNA-binding CsgD family transcriptional regulator